MPNDDKKTLKEKRQERQAERVGKFTEAAKTEAKRAGYDVDKTVDIGPLGEERKKRIDEAVTKGIEGDIKTELERIQSLRQAPEVEVPEKPESDYTIKDVRRQRRAKLGDILTAFSQGYYGKPVDPTQFRDRLKDERLAQYQQYKGASEAAKKTLGDWETNYINEQLNYIDSKLKDPHTTETQKRQLEILDQNLRLEKAKVETEKARAGKIREETKLLPEQSKYST